MSNQSQYALVHDGKLVPGPNAPLVTANGREPPNHYSANHPAGCKWLPVVSVDSEPFDLERHFRLKPSYRVAGDRVERVYPVVPKGAA